MGKKKDGKGPIPKEIGGFKVPKGLRRAGKKLVAKANSPAGREAIAAGLAIAATIAGEVAKKSREGGGAPHARPDGGKPAAEAKPAPPRPANAADNDSAKAAAAGSGHRPASPDLETLGKIVAPMAEAALGRLFGARPKSPGA